MGPGRTACGLSWPGFQTPEAGPATAPPSSLCLPPSSSPPSMVRRRGGAVGPGARRPADPAPALSPQPDTGPRHFSDPPGPGRWVFFIRDDISHPSLQKAAKRPSGISWLLVSPFVARRAGGVSPAGLTVSRHSPSERPLVQQPGRDRVALRPRHRSFGESARNVFSSLPPTSPLSFSVSRTAVQRQRRGLFSPLRALWEVHLSSRLLCRIVLAVRVAPRLGTRPSAPRAFFIPAETVPPLPPRVRPLAESARPSPDRVRLLGVRCSGERCLWASGRTRCPHAFPFDFPSVPHPFAPPWGARPPPAGGA